MRRRGGRVIAGLVWLAAIGAAGYHWRLAERERAAIAAERDAFEQDAWRTALAIAHLETAGCAAVATAPRAEFWLARATAARQAVEAGLAALRRGRLAPEARQALDHAATVLRDFDELDRRAREYLGLDQTLFALDLILGDARDRLSAAARDLEAARRVQTVNAEGELASASRRQQVLAGSALAATLLLVVLLLPAGAAPEPAAAEVAAAEAPGATAGADVDREIGAALDAELESKLAPRVPTAPLTGVTGGVDFAATAALCSELARVADTRDLSALVARAAHILGATGVVLWAPDPSAAALVPAIVHGYPPDAVAHLGRIPRDADNATAVAYRAGRTQVVAGAPGRTGAIIAPLVSVAGCAGVMAAELPHPREAEGSVRAAAEILAAQLATLVAPPSAAAPATSAPASA
jgi:hypothetical protein